MKKHLGISLITIVFLFTADNYSQDYNLRFNRITTADGISQAYVICAFQDSKGFMWFGTQDGLNRYDGYNFKVYRHIPNDPTSLSENWIWNIYEDRQGYLWIGTFGGGACRFDRSTETFKTYRNNPSDTTSISDNTIWGFYESDSGLFWVAANNGLNLFNLKNESFIFFEPPGKSKNVFNVLPLSESELIMSTHNAILLFNTQTKKFKRIDHNQNDKNSIGIIGTNLFVDKSGICLAGTINDGLTLYNPFKNIAKRYYKNPEDPDNSLAHNTVNDVYVDNFGYVWAATNNGLSLMRFSGEKLLSVKNYYSEPVDQHSLSGNFLTNIYESRSGEFWISGRDALNRFDRNNQKFKHFKVTSNKKNSLSHSGVLPIIASKKNHGIVWIGTRDGLNRFDEKTNSFKHYKRNPNNPNNSLSSNYILSLYEDKKGNLWVGTRGGGLSKMVLSGSGYPTFTNYKLNPNDPFSLSANNVHCIYEDSNGELWIGTGGGGLNKLNRATGKFKRYSSSIDELDDTENLNDMWVYCMLEDSYGNFWLGTAAGGINLFDRENNSFIHFKNNPLNPNSLSNNRVLGIFETGNGDLWIATAMGLNKLIRPQNKGEDYSFIQYYKKDGLPNDVIYGLLEDEQGNLWISTNRGLCKIHFEGEKIKVRKYSVSDGLQSEEFDQNSYCMAPSGKMYFGGVNGFNVFNPDSVRDNPFIPPVVITDFKILNESVPIRQRNRAPSNLLVTSNNSYEGSVFLEKSITETDTIELSYSDDVISFEFAALNFTMPEMNQYAYKMEGFDKDWVYCGTRRFVTYTHLNPGEYIFKVRGSNNDGIWNEAGTSIVIFINPPPWLSWYAYLVYIFIFFCFIYFIIRYRINKAKREMETLMKIEQAKQQEREEVRKKSSADFHDEAGNKLTKITLFTELAKRESDNSPSAKEYLAKIEEITKEISTGMRDFIWVLDPSRDSLADTIDRLGDFGNSMFGFTSTVFTVTGLTDYMHNVNLSMESRRAIMLIFKEAMNNCLKYADAKKVELAVHLQNSVLTVSLADDGDGFDLNEKANGYGLKNMSDRASKLNGELSINSQPGKGTTITFSGKLTHMGD